MHKDRIAAVVLIMLAVCIFVVGAKIPDASLGEGPGPEAFPMFLAAMLTALSSALFFIAGHKKKKEEPKEAAQAQDEIQKIDEPLSAKRKRVISSIILLIIYFIILPFAGFIGSTIIFGIGFLSILYSLKLKECLLPAVAITIFAFVMFELGLSVPLPAFMEAIK